MNQADWSGVTNGLQSIDVKVTDVAGNVTTITQPVNIALIQPTISVTSAFAGGTLDYDESRLVQTLTGTSTNLEAGQKITITIGGKTSRQRCKVTIAGACRSRRSRWWA